MANACWLWPLRADCRLVDGGSTVWLHNREVSYLTTILQRKLSTAKRIKKWQENFRITHNRTVCTIDIARQGNCLMTHVFSGHTPHVIQEKYLCQFFYFRRSRSQPFSVFFRAMREISKTPAREWGEKRRGALKCWEKWTLPCPCSFKIKLLKELATTN